MREAAAYVRARNGPAFVHARVIRPYSHSLSDDEKLCKPPAEREAEARRDPIARFAEFLKRQRPRHRRRARRDGGRRRGARSTTPPSRRSPRRSRRRTPPTLWVYSPDVDPSSAALRHAGAARRQARHDGRGDQPHAQGRDGARPAHRRLRRGRGGRQQEEALPLVPGKGGVFKLTHGLQRLYGDDRVFNSPLAEASIVGRAVGMATRGLKPVVEIQFFDYIWPAMMQIRDELTMMRYRSGNTWSCPMVIRVPIGGYLRGGGPYHSQSGESIFAHCPGIRIAYPSNAVDAAGLLRTVDPLRRPGAVPRAQAPLPADLQQGRVSGQRLHDPVRPREPAPRRRPTCSSSRGARSCSASLLAAQQAEKDHISVAVLDLRTIVPCDWDAIASHVKRTNRVVIAHEDQVMCGFGAEIAARIAGELFEHLDAPGQARRRAQRPGGVPPRPRGSDPAAVVRHPEGHPRNGQILTAGWSRRAQSPRCFSAFSAHSAVLVFAVVCLSARSSRTCCDRTRAVPAHVAGRFREVDRLSAIRLRPVISSSIAAATPVCGSTNSSRARGRSCRSAAESGRIIDPTGVRRRGRRHVRRRRRAEPSRAHSDLHAAPDFASAASLLRGRGRGSRACSATAC